MAEALGAVASGIAVVQLTVEIGKAIAKLNDLCNEVDEAPETLRFLLVKAEILEALLDAVSKELVRCPDAAFLTTADTAWKGFHYCKDALQSLTDIIAPLLANANSAKSSKRLRGKISIALKREAIERCERRLQYAIDILQFAKQEHSTALLRNQLAAIEQHMQSKSSKPLKPVTRDSSNGSGQETLQKKKITQLPQKQTWKYNVKFQMWQAACRLSLSRSISGWQINLQPYSIRPKDSQVFKHAAEGDFQGLYRLINTGQASPFDRDENGESLLHARPPYLVRERDLLTLCFIVCFQIHEYRYHQILAECRYRSHRP
jgi:hypothetical protein